MLARLPPGPVLLLGAPGEVPATLADTDWVFTLIELAPALRSTLTASDAPDSAISVVGVGVGVGVNGMSA